MSVLKAQICQIGSARRCVIKLNCAEFSVVVTRWNDRKTCLSSWLERLLLISYFNFASQYIKYAQPYSCLNGRGTRVINSNREDSDTISATVPTLYVHELVCPFFSFARTFLGSNFLNLIICIPRKLHPHKLHHISCRASHASLPLERFQHIIGQIVVFIQ